MPYTSNIVLGIQIQSFQQRPERFTGNETPFIHPPWVGVLAIIIRIFAPFKTFLYNIFLEKLFYSDSFLFIYIQYIKIIPFHPILIRGPVFMMPVLFVGHGSPMNIVEENEYTRGWRQVAEDIPHPAAILSVSAHWFSRNTGIYTGASPRTIHDFFGFPKILYGITYPAPGAPQVAREAIDLLRGAAVEDNSWGLDHGTWSVLLTMYPSADIPVFQISIDSSAPPERHLALGRLLRPLRKENVLIMGSGNIVHNLALLDFRKNGGFDWAEDFDAYIDRAVKKKSAQDILHYQRAGRSARYAFHVPDHFYPLLYVLGAAFDRDKVSDFNHSCLAGSLSMTSYVFGN